LPRKEPRLDLVERKLQASLQSRCPTPHEIGEYQMALLATDQMTMVGAHVNTCPHCQAELKQLTAFLADESPSLGDQLESIREVVVEWGRSILSPQPGMALAGIRGGQGRAQTFTAAHLWLAVTVQEAENGRKNLLALVTREDGYPLEHGTAWLSQENRLFSGGRIDNAGNLVIADLEPGDYDLGIQCDGTRVWVRGVSV
jgi:hypothetical protein